MRTLRSIQGDAFLRPHPHCQHRASLICAEDLTVSMVNANNSIDAFVSRMSNRSNYLSLMDQQRVTFKRSRRIQMIKRLVCLIALLDFLLHYAVTVDLGALEQMSRLLGRRLTRDSRSIHLCHLPIKQYLPFSLSEVSVYVLYLSLWTLILATEAMRKSSLNLYRLCIVMKFSFALGSLLLWLVYTVIDRKLTFIHTPLMLRRAEFDQTNGTSVSIDLCLSYAREKTALDLLAILNVVLFFTTVQCSKVFVFLQRCTRV